MKFLYQPYNNHALKDKEDTNSGLHISTIANMSEIFPLFFYYTGANLQGKLQHSGSCMQTWESYAAALNRTHPLLL